jgi:hypothetical protein
MTAKTKPAETAPAVPALTFREAEVPALERTNKPNPFDETVAALAAAKGQKATEFDAADEKQAKSLVALAQKAGSKHGVSVRNRRQIHDDGRVTVTIWAVEKITRPRADAPATA